METKGSEIAKMLNSESFGASQVNIYMEHLIIHVEASCSADIIEDIKIAIDRLINERFPSRVENLPFLIRRGTQPDLYFMLYKPNRFNCQI